MRHPVARPRNSVIASSAIYRAAAASSTGNFANDRHAAPIRARWRPFAFDAS
jgi:hypothetical protein